MYVTETAIAAIAVVKMQLSTSRVNFTSSSVAHFNYVRFLSKRGSINGISDIATVLGLHSENFTKSFPFILSKKLRRLSRSFKNTCTVIVHVPSKKLKINIRKSKKWFSFIVVALNKKYIRIEIECDLRTGITMCVCKINKSGYFYVFRFKKNFMGVFQETIIQSK